MFFKNNSNSPANFIVNKILFNERLILLFIFLRPTLDMGRDLNLIKIGSYYLNLTSATSIIFLIWSALMFLKYFKFIIRTPLFVHFLLLQILMLSGLWFGLFPADSLAESIKFINISSFFLLSYVFVTKHKLTSKTLLKTILASAVLPVIFALTQLIFGLGIDTSGIHGRIFGTLAHPNVFAFFVLSLIFLHTEYSTTTPTEFWQKNKGLKIAVYFLLLVLLIFTYTRITLIGLGVFIFILGLYKYKKLLLGCVTAILLFYLIFPPFDKWTIKTFNYSFTEIGVVGRLVNRNEDADSINWRLSVLRETVPLIYRRPLFGYGYGTFPKVWVENRSLAHQWDDGNQAHNDYLRIALELGLVGFFVYASLLLHLLYLAAWPILKNKDRAKHIHLFAWVCVFVVVSLSDNMLNHTPVMWLTWAWWGATLANTPKPHPSPNLLHS